MKRIFLLALLFPAVVVAQYEQVQIKWNKLALFPGAQAKFFAAVVAKDGYPSTSLYMQLYADSGGAPLNTWKWRADSGCAAGSFPAPQKPGFYWVRSYSAGSDMVVFSLRVRPKNPTYTIRRFSDSLHGKFLEHQAVWLSRDAGGYYLLNTGLDVRYFGVSVSDTGSYSPPQTWAVQRRTGDYRRDTGYLRMRFRAFAKTPVARQQIVYSIPADSNYGGPDVRRLDTAGEAVFTHITFEDSALIFYMRNHSDEEIGLAQVKEMDTLPRFTIPGGYVLDTINHDPTPIPGEKGAKVLDTVYKSAPWGMENIHLHNQFVKGNIYLEAGIDWHQNYDLRKIPPSPWTANIYDYISRDVHPHFDAGLDWFLDGNWIPPEMAMHLDLKTIRYVEFRTGPGVWGYWHPDQPANYGLIFSKVGNDALDVKSAFKHLGIKGYDAAPADEGVQKDGSVFDPKTSANKYYLGRTPPFRLAVMAVSGGQVYYREEIIVRE